MLEVKSLSKIYKTKNGADVKALDDVSIRFPEKGMVFLLGKSGSGKSTLLNVCGGLDAPTSGEIIVKGRSSKDFTQSDFDSYRNTYVGFIFQEYNILNEFSVEDNIALALELQGKPKDKEAVKELLRQVELEGFAKRKPNTLSGGQKQRIAIARALVKSPEIIMADEPTGALDSATGKQVFETLKKLSQDKLVLVVSHDREFAEQYGDRIIELKDGQILSDVTKTQEQQTELSENIRAIGDVLCVKKGKELDENDFNKIKEFLKKSRGDIIIAGNDKDVKAFKKVSRINDEGEKEVFLDTKEEQLDKKVYGLDDSKFIRSKLPAKHAIRIGISSLKTKPVRLFFTILLCAVAFTLFGLLSTMSFYDSESTFKQTLKDSDHSLVAMQKRYTAEEVVFQNGEETYRYETVLEGKFSQNELEEWKQEFGPDVFGGVSMYNSYNIRTTTAPYWINDITAAAYLPEDNSLRGSITGDYPKSKDEVCISSYMADVIIDCKAYDETGNVLDVASREELLGKKMNISGTAYKIVGIFDSGEISEKYEILKSSESENEQLKYQLSSELSDGLHLTIFVNQERLEKIAEQYKAYAGDELIWYRRAVVTGKKEDGKYVYPEYSNISYETGSEIPAKEKIVYADGEKSSLADGEIIMSQNALANLFMEQYSQKIELFHMNENWQEAEKLSKSQELCGQIMSGGVWKTNSETKKDELVAFTDEELTQKVAQMLSNAKKDKISLTVSAKLFDDQAQSSYGEAKEFKIVGVVLGTSENGGNEKMYVSDFILNKWWDEQKLKVDFYTEVSTNYADAEDAVYGNIFLPYDKSETQTQRLWEIYSNEKYEEDGSRAKLHGNFIGKLEMIDSMVHSLSQVFLYVGLALAVFAALLLSNFISVSISQKKKEIGILRAVGARSLDVFKIFFSESFFITLICVILATIASIVTCNMLNTNVASELGASLFVFGVVSFIVLVLIALVTTVLATFLPVWNAAKKKPVDSIRAL